MKSSFAATVSVFSATLLLAACSPDKNEAGEQGNAAAPTTSEAVANAEASLVNENSEVLEFSYGYPAEAASFAILARQLDQDRDAKLSQNQKAAQDDADQAKANGYPVRPHMFKQIWQTVAQTPRFLSLSSDIETYTGGAHGMVSFDTLLWDKDRNQSLQPIDLFVSAIAFDAAISKDFCEAIDAAKKAKGIEPNSNLDGTFETCPKASEQSIWLGSSDNQAFDRITIGITAYVVGPYVEGNYRIDVPMNAAVVRAVQPEFTNLFRATK